MNIFLIGWDDEYPELIDVAKTLGRHGYAVSYWLGARDQFSRFAHEFPDTIFHDYRDAFALIAPREVDQSGFLPPGKDMLRKLYETESLLMTMMNKHYPHLGVSERKHVYYQMVRYWNGVLERRDPRAVIFPMAPHTAPDFVLYNLAKLKGIKTLMFHATEVSDRLLLMDNFIEGSRALRHEAESARGKKHTLQDITPDLRSYYEARAHGKFVTPLSISLLHEQFSGFRLLRAKIVMVTKSLRDGSFVHRFGRYILKPFSDNARKEYRRVAQFADFSKTFVYFPLQYQPEATTSPLADVFADQRLTVETLSASLPEGWLLYVKEHPAEWTRQTSAFTPHRYKGYYAAMARLPNVRIVPVETPTQQLTDAAQAIVTNTGTAGWEATLKFKPVLTFGYPWYVHARGVFPVHDTQSCKDAFASIRNGFRGTEQELINFLYAFDKASVHGYLEGYSRRLATIAPAEATKNIAGALLAAIERS